MKIDISNILKINGASLDIELNEMVEGSEIMLEGFAIYGPVSLKGSLTNVGDIIKLDGELSASYKVNCFRCLKKVESKIDVTVSEDFIEEGSNKIEDAYTYQGKYVELEKVIKDNIILNLPVKQVCDEECKGFCPKCGVDLNDKECKCSEEEIDPRMEALKEFFKNQ